MKVAIIDSQGIVSDVFVVDSLSDMPNAVECPDHIGIGHNINDPAPEPFIDPVPTQPVPKCTPLQFIEKFTDAEQLAIVTAAMSSPALRLWYDKLMASQEVVFSDPRMSSGMEALVTFGLISEARSEEILPLSLRSTGMQAV